MKTKLAFLFGCVVGALVAKALRKEEPFRLSSVWTYPEFDDIQWDVTCTDEPVFFVVNPDWTSKPN